MSRMKLSNISTPATLLDMNTLNCNIQNYCRVAKDYGKQIWPMIKTHKSTEIAKMQAEAGCTGFLCGTLDECEALARTGFRNIMYAYPVASESSICRVVKLAETCNFIIRLDGMDAAAAVNAVAERAGVKVNYTIIIDSGLHRFGIDPKDAGKFAESMKQYKSLVFKGISSHPGHVYAASCYEDIATYVADECNAVQIALSALAEKNIFPEIVSSGSTPTFRGAISNDNIMIYHPGNYVFNDVIQLSTKTATEQECALTILTTIISHPQEDVFICDAGAKCLGLDQGAHGNTSIKGYGKVVGHPEITVFGLSEEVGKLTVNGNTDLKVGDKIRIIPNHTCSSANLTKYYIGICGDEVDCVIEVDIRGNSTKKGVC